MAVLLEQTLLVAAVSKQFLADSLRFDDLGLGRYTMTVGQSSSSCSRVGGRMLALRHSSSEPMDADARTASASRIAPLRTPAAHVRPTDCTSAHTPHDLARPHHERLTSHPPQAMQGAARWILALDASGGGTWTRESQWSATTLGVDLVQRVAGADEGRKPAGAGVADVVLGQRELAERACGQRARKPARAAVAEHGVVEAELGEARGGAEEERELASAFLAQQVVAEVEDAQAFPAREEVGDGGQPLRSDPALVESEARHPFALREHRQVSGSGHAQVVVPQIQRSQAAARFERVREKLCAPWPDAVAVHIQALQLPPRADRFSQERCSLILKVVP
eukprot:2387604-Rhodomonas_salina.1